MKKSKIIYVLGIVLYMLVAACSKMDDPTKPYTDKGEIIYSTRVDSLKAFPGNHRVKLTWLLPTNHSAVEAVAYWNGKLDSRELPLVKNSNNVYEAVLDNMLEASYLFNVYTYDKKGNASVKAEVSAVVYGENYMDGLLNWVYIKATKTNPSTLTVNWIVAENSQKAVEIEYTKTSGGLTSVVSVPKDNATILTNVDFAYPIRYRTIYNPGKVSIDDFPSKWTPLTLR